jgi:hypothetical protein
MTRTSSRRLITGAHHCGKTTTLVESAAAYLAAGYTATDVLALSVHRQAVQGLRTALSNRTGQDIPTADLRRRALALLEQFPEAAGLPAGWKNSEVISAMDRRVLMRRAWAEVASGPETLYARFANAPGALDWLAQLFNAFAEWAGTADPSRLLGPPPTDPVLAELWEVYRGYLVWSRRLGLVAFQEVLPRALDVLRHEEVHAAIVPRLLLLDDLDLFRPSELLFARSLAGADTTILGVVAKLPAIDDPDPRLRFLARWCVELGFTGEQGHVGSSPAVTDVRDAVYPTPAHEADAIARHIATTFGPHSCFADYAVVCFDPDLVPLLRRTLPQWSIAVDGMEARDAYTLPLAPLLHAGMRLIAGTPMAQEDLAAFLRHPVLGMSPTDSHLLTTMLAEIGGTAGADPLGVLKRRPPQECSPAGRALLQQLVAATETARATRLLPSAKLRRWIADLDLHERAAAITQAVLSPAAVSADATLTDRWLEFLQRSERLRAELGVPLDDVEAVEALRATQALVEPISPRLADAVQLWQPDQISACAAPFVWLAGLHEHALPQHAAPLPWAEPEAFTDLDWLPGFVAPQRDDRAARRHKALGMLERAGAHAQDGLFLSWSRTDARGRRRLPSPVLGTYLQELHTDAGAMRTPEDPRFQTGIAIRPHLAAPMLAPAANAVEGEQRTVPTPNAERAPEPLTPFATSPTAIEDYLLCPRRYFYARVLQLYDVVASPRQALGQVVHAALQDLKAADDSLPAEALVERHWNPVQRRFGSHLREAAFRRLAEQAVSNVAAYDAERDAGETQFVVGEAAFRWQIAPHVELRGKIDRVDRGPDGLIVLDYKLGADSPSINALLGMFAPPGDEHALGAWRPTDLQLPLYALAVEQGQLEGGTLAPGERVSEIGLVYPLQLRTATGKPAAGGRRMVEIVEHSGDCGACAPRSGLAPARGMLCRRQLQQIVDRALVVVAGMRAGDITPDPREGATTCNRCPFRTICPAALA